jgi:hypothetical protein
MLVPRLAAAAVFVAVFVLVWAPLGQRGYLETEWPYLGLAGAAALAFATAATAGRAEGLTSRSAVLLLVLALYLVHQFEEHGIDLTGQRFAFETVMNAMVGARFGCAGSAPCPFNPQNIFLINTTLVWWALALLLVVGARSLLADLCGVSIMFVNALTHIAAAAATGAYNPGLATSLALFLPGSVFAAWALARTYRTGLSQAVPGALLYGVALHVLLLLATYFTYARSLLPVSAFFVVLVLVATVPAVLALMASRRPAALRVR